MTRSFVVVVAAALGVAQPALAHDLKAVVTVTAAEVKVEAGYDDDTPAEGAKVALAAADGAAVADGTLDDRGRWATTLPPPGDYVVVVNDIGHRDRVTFTIPEPPAPTAPPAETTHTSWRLDKTLGAVVGLGVLLGGSLLYTLIRRRRG